jgi:hypothetical protein
VIIVKRDEVRRNKLCVKQFIET